MTLPALLLLPAYPAKRPKKSVLGSHLELKACFSGTLQHNPVLKLRAHFCASRNFFCDVEAMLVHLLAGRTEVFCTLGL